MLSETENSSLFTFFSSKGGIIEQQTWENIPGFAGRINNSENNLGAFISAFPPLEIFEDPLVETQMNTVQDQINFRPEIAMWNNYSLRGTKNASIAIIDTGVDYSHSFFNYSYGYEDFNQTIIGWTDLLSDEKLPNDRNGHGTAMSSIIAGNDNLSAISNHSGNSFYLTKNIAIDHSDYFYPHYLSEKWYDVKLGSFEMDENALDLLQITANLSIQSNMQDYRLQLYRNGNIINETSLNPFELTWDTSGIFDSSKKPGIYDIVFSYYKNLEQTPRFTLQMQVQFTPKGYPHLHSEYSGIAPDSRITMIRALNDTGKGYLSDLISGLEEVLMNISSNHIITLLISVASFDIPQSLQNYIEILIDELINQGCMVIFAAGNSGVGDKLNNLAVSKKALIVGAVNDQDQLTDYSAQSSLSDDVRSLDLLAPGGSKWSNSQMIITADSNMGDLFNNTSDLIRNDLTAMTGTSISAAILAGVYNLVVDYLGGWKFWKSGVNITEEALKIKNYLLLTASETNLPREDNPFTPFDESSNSPTLDRGENDPYEGYGRINPEAVLNMLNNSLELNHTYQLDLAASDSNPFQRHVFALNITLVKDQLYIFNLTNNEGFFSNFDVDLYLYDKQGTRDGYPILLASATNAGTTDETLYFTNVNATDTFYLVVKAVSGTGSCDLTVYPKFQYSNPTLNNHEITVQSDLGYNDTLDIYQFEINYTQSENIPATNIILVFPSINQNYSLTQAQILDLNYENGAIYQINVHFENPGNFSYYFIARTGSLFVNYLHNTSISILVNPIHHFAGTNFSTEQGLIESFWDAEFEDTKIWRNNYPTTVSVGWHPLTVSQNLEPRWKNESEDSWKSWYFGYALSENSSYYPLVQDFSPLYTYENTTGIFTLDSPIVWLENITFPNFSPILELGSRISINQGDTLRLEINVNRSDWVTLDYWTYEQYDWTLSKYNLSNYVNNYVQVRLRMEVDSSQWILKKGIFVDYFSVGWKNITNSHQPVLAPAFSTDNQEIPLSKSKNETKWGDIEFNIGYWDADGDFPVDIFLEIDNYNHSLYNVDGIWKTGAYNHSIDLQIRYSCNIPLIALENYSFRFLASDGKYNVSTPWFNIDLSNQYEILPFPVVNLLSSANFMRWGFPHNLSTSEWDSPSSGWHQVQTLKSLNLSQEWYCGIGDYAGYSHNFDARLYSPIIHINASHEAFLYLSHRLRFDSEGNEGNDFAEILISDDYGDSWHSLQLFEKETPGINFTEIAVELSEYNEKDIILQFLFHSDNSGEQIQNSGWKIKELSININTTKDYNPPQIIFSNIKDGETIQGVLNITIYIQDDSAIDKFRTEMWVDNHQIDVQLDSNQTISLEIDTRPYKNGYSLEIIIVVYDIEGNRQFEKIHLIVDNPPSTISLIIYSLFGVLGLILLGIYSYKQYIKHKLIKEGKYVRQPTWIERIQQAKFETNKTREEALMILDQLDLEWEKMQPMRLFCKKCHRMYISPEFEIFCPHCKESTLYVAKYCPVCKKWNYFDEDTITTQCKKCHLTLVKDFNKAKAHIIEFQKKNISMVLISEEDKQALQNIIEKLSLDELIHLYEEIKDKKLENDS